MGKDAFALLQILYCLAGTAQGAQLFLEYCMLNMFCSRVQFDGPPAKQSGLGFSF